MVLYSMQSTVRDRDFRINAIYRELDKHNELGYNELERIVVFQKKIMSQRPFREKLAEMVSSGIISRRPEEYSSRVWYSTKIKFVETELMVMKVLSENIQHLEKQYEILVNPFSKMTTIEKANILTLFYKLIYAIEYNYSNYFGLIYSKNTTIKKNHSKLNQLKGKLFHLVHSESDKQTIGQIMSIIHSSFQKDEEILLNEIESILHTPE